MRPVFTLEGIVFRNVSSSTPSEPIPSSDTSLTVFTVNGTPVEDGQDVLLSTGVTEATIVATSVVGATADSPTGGTSLVIGNNAWSMLVTAEDGVTTHTYTLNLDVAPSKPTVEGSFAQVEHTKTALGGVASEATAPDHYVIRIDSSAEFEAGTTRTNLVTPEMSVGDHTVEVKAVDILGNGSTYSDPASVTISAYPLDAPGTPSLFSGAMGDMDVGFTDSSFHPYGYTIRTSPSSSAPTTVDVSGGITLHGLESGESITVYVKTKGDGDLFIESSEVSGSATVS